MLESQGSCAAIGHRSKGKNVMLTHDLDPRRPLDYFIFDNRLSLAARGLMGMLVALNPQKPLHINRIIPETPHNETQVRRFLKELEALDYIAVDRGRIAILRRTAIVTDSERLEMREGLAWAREQEQAMARAATARGCALN